MTEPQHPVTVTAADREAAAFVHAAQYGADTPGYEWILSGEQDDDVSVQAFARHRIQAAADARKTERNRIIRIARRELSKLDSMMPTERAAWVIHAIRN